ncbi:hypothetical protein QSL37_001318 [Campylobacter jejuni]|nr:hypothetical protein [Campylobacter jejuni]
MLLENIYYNLLNANFTNFMMIIIFFMASLAMILSILSFILKILKIKLKEMMRIETISILIFFTLCLFSGLFLFQAKIPNQAYIKKLEKENIMINPYDFIFSGYKTLGFGICEKNNYTGETCLNYLKYFEKIEKDRILKEKISNDERQKIIEENIKKISQKE